MYNVKEETKMENINLIDKYEVTMKGLSFGRAFDYINDVAKRRVTFPNDWSIYGMRLPKWSSDVVIKVQYPDKYSKMTAPYLYVESRFGRVPWKETNIELFDNTWEIVKFEGTLNNSSNSEDIKSVDDIKNTIIKDIANANTSNCTKECSNQKEKSNCCNCNKTNVTKKQVKQVDHNDALDSIIDALIIGNLLF